MFGITGHMCIWFGDRFFAGTLSNAYILEDDSDFYETEDGLFAYVTEV